MIQSILIISGLYLSLRNLRYCQNNSGYSRRETAGLVVPMGGFLVIVAVLMLNFFTN